MSMTNEQGGALGRVRTFWRRTLFGPSVVARIEIYEELAPTLAAGIGLREALQATTDRHSGAKRRAVELLSDGVERDVPMSVTMRANPEFFTLIEAAIVETGERTGRMDVAFRGAAAQLERAKAVRTRMWQSVSYPLLLVHCFILMCSVVRMFGGGSFLLLAVPSFALLWGGIFLVASVHAARQDSEGYARRLRSIPLFGSVLRVGSLARFARVFAALYGSGVAYGEALLIAGQASGDAVMCAEAVTAASALDRGASLPEALTRMPSIPSDDMGLLLAGEKSGELEGAALRVSVLEDARYDVSVNRMAGLLRNGLVVVMGCAVGLYAVSFYAKYYGAILDIK
jgi:type IV pilus assembly protein PilC